MIKQQESKYLKQYNNHIQSKIISSIIITFIILFFSYMLISIIKANQTIQQRIRHQYAYLNIISKKMDINNDKQYQSMLMFIDSAAAFLEKIQINNSESTQCKPQYFDCNISKADNYTAFEKIYPYIKSFSYLLSKVYQINSIMILNKNKHIIFNLNGLHLTNISKIQPYLTQKILQQILNKSILANKYIFSQIVSDNKTHITICQELSINKDSLLLCATIERLNMEFIIQNLQNLYYVSSFKNDNGMYINNNSQQASFEEYQNQIKAQISKIKVKINQNFKQCVLNIPSNLQTLTSGKFENQINCLKNQHSFLNIFGYSYIFVYRKHFIQKNVMHKKHKQLFPQQKISYNTYVAANSTFYSDCKKIISSTLYNIRYIGFGFIIVLAALLFSLLYSDNILHNLYIKSIMKILQLSQLLKNKEIKQLQNQLKSISDNEIFMFSFILNYFQKFIWINKIINQRLDKKIYKKILLQGIELFKKEQQAKILQFIYKQLIHLQLQFIKKLQKLKSLSNKDKQKIQNNSHQPIKSLLQLPSLQIKQNKSSRKMKSNYELEKDSEQLMINIQQGLRPNRGVRFSNDIQTIQFGQGPVLRKWRQQKIYTSNQTIELEGEDNQNQTVQKQSHKQSSKSQLEQKRSIYDGNWRIKSRDYSLNNFNFDDIYADLQKMKIDEQSQSQDMQKEDQIYNMDKKDLIKLMQKGQQAIIHYSEELIEIKKTQINVRLQDQLYLKVNQIYASIIQKYRRIYKLLMFKKENGDEQQKNNTQKIESFQDLKYFQMNYHHHLSHQLLQQAEIVKLFILYALSLPTSLKNLQFLAGTNFLRIKIAARHLLALCAQDIQPHLDLCLVKNLCLNLKQQKLSRETTSESLNILIKNLERYPNFIQQLSQLKLSKQFYNKKNKKFYFIVSLSNMKYFIDILTKLYELIDSFDAIRIYNLNDESTKSLQTQRDNNELITSKNIKKHQYDNLKYLVDVYSFIDMFNFGKENQTQTNKQSNNKSRTNSSKTINKKTLFERDFHDILLSLEADDINSSKYVIVLLYDDHTLDQTEQSSSSGNSHSFQQKLHLQITKIIENGYFHFILIGYNLHNHHSKFSRIKKYVRISPQLLEINLSDKDEDEKYKELQNYIL